MKTQFTTAFIKANCGCYSQQDLEGAFIKERRDVCFKDDTCKVSLSDVFNSSILTEDKYWFLYTNALTKKEKIKLTLRVLNLVEGVVYNQYPEDFKKVQVHFKKVGEFYKDKISYTDLAEAWVTLYNSMSPRARGGWVVDSCCNYYCSVASGGFGLYYVIYLSRRSEISKELYALVAQCIGL